MKAQTLVYEMYIEKWCFIEQKKG